MTYFCVPSWRSNGNDRLSGISFHEISADATLWEKCLRAIEREGSLANSTYKYSRALAGILRKIISRGTKDAALRLALCHQYSQAIRSTFHPDPWTRAIPKAQKQCWIQHRTRGQDEPARKRKWYQEDVTAVESASEDAENSELTELETQRYWLFWGGITTKLKLKMKPRMVPSYVLHIKQYKSVLIIFEVFAFVPDAYEFLNESFIPWHVWRRDGVRRATRPRKFLWALCIASLALLIPWLLLSGFL